MTLNIKFISYRNRRNIGSIYKKGSWFFRTWTGNPFQGKSYGVGIIGLQICIVLKNYSKSSPLFTN